MRLFIAEKPLLARSIVDALGGGRNCGTYYECGNDKVTWCIGHMLELFEPEDYNPEYAQWNLAHLPIYETPLQYKVKQGTKAQLESILTLIQQADSIVHAGDPDPEGQLIVDEILEFCGNKKPVQRFMTNDENIAVVKKSLAKMQPNDKYYNLYQSAFARNVGDQLYGFNMTRAYTVAAREQGYDGVLSVGRVQTPILGLVVARDRANANHEKQPYYQVVGQFQFDSLSFDAQLVVADDAPVDDKKRIIDRPYAVSIAAQCSKKSCVIESANSEIKKANPPLPYNQLKLQADASKKFGYKPHEVMQITQDLREKYKLITYNGSDCQYLNEEQHDDAAGVLEAIGKTTTEYYDITGNADAKIKSRAFNNKNVGAHPAIIPTQATADFNQLSEKEQNIYRLVARAYIAQFYPKHEYRDTTIIINCENHHFVARSKITLSEGWRVLYQNDTSNEDETDQDQCKLDLSVLTDKQQGQCLDASVLDKETQPLPLYTMDALLNDLTRIVKYVVNPKIKQLLIDKDKEKKGEHGGIGTSRTRDQIIKKLFDIGFLTEKGKKIISTDIGQQFYDALPEVATRPDMTAYWHEQQEAIERGEFTVDQFIDNLMQYITQQVNVVKTEGLSITVEQYTCPECNTGHLKKRKGKSLFWGCSNFPDCQFTVANRAGKPDFKSLETHPCPSCDKPMKRRKGKNGFFWGCTGYPDCKQTYPDKRGKPDTQATTKSETKAKASDQFHCGECEKPLIRRPSKKGKGFWWGCSGYPTCKKTYQDKSGKPDMSN